MKKILLPLLMICCLVVFCAELYARPAIIIASFGTTVPEAVESIDNIADRVKNAYPTSNTIRTIWQEQSTDPDLWRMREIKKVIVQPTHLFHMEQYDKNAWNSGFERSGHKVEIKLEGLGSNNQFADIFVSNIKDAAKDAGIVL